MNDLTQIDIILYKKGIIAAPAAGVQPMPRQEGVPTAEMLAKRAQLRYTVGEAGIHTQHPYSICK